MNDIIQLIVEKVKREIEESIIKGLEKSNICDTTSENFSLNNAVDFFNYY